jgi:hypothetical protein
MMVDIDAERLACGERRLCARWLARERNAEAEYRRCGATEKLPPRAARSF